MDNPEPGTSNAAQFGDFSPVENPWRIKHPVVTFFHLLFRTLALIGNNERRLLIEINLNNSLPQHISCAVGSQTASLAAS